MKNSSLYINQNGNEKKCDFGLLIDLLLMLMTGAGIVTVALCIPYL